MLDPDADIAQTAQYHLALGQFQGQVRLLCAVTEQLAERAAGLPSDPLATQVFKDALRELRKVSQRVPGFRELLVLAAAKGDT